MGCEGREGGRSGKKTKTLKSSPFYFPYTLFALSTHENTYAITTEGDIIVRCQHGKTTIQSGLKVEVGLVLQV